MALSVNHSKVSAIPDGADTSVVRPSDWNAGHVFSGATSGGVPYFSSTTVMDSSGLLTANALVLGGGAGVAPSTPVGLGTTTQVLHGNAGGAPTWGAVSLTADIQGGTANSIVLAGGAGASPSTPVGLGTTTQVLHGNAGGAPTWGAVNLANDVTGTLGVANGGNVAVHPGYVANSWYIPWPYTGVLGTSGAPGNGTIHFIPFIPSQTMTISTLGIRIVTAGTTNVQLAIYASQTAAAGKRPTGNALSSTASIVNTGAASSVNAALGANVQVTAGTLYFLALNCNDGTMTSVSMAASTAMPGIVLGSATQATSLGASATVTHLTFAQAFGTWPDMTSNSCTESTASSYALVQFKVASIP